MTIREIVEFIRTEERKPEKYRSEASIQAVREYRKYLYDHYITLFKRYKEQNKNIKNIDELYCKTIKFLCDNYISYEYATTLSDYISVHMKRINKNKIWDLTIRHGKPAPVRELIVEARKGNNKSKEKLISHYKEHYSYFIVENKNIENIEKKYEKYVELLVTYYIENETVRMSDLIKNKLEIATKNKDWDTENVEEFFHPVSDLIDKSRAGSLEAKQKLIERYMYVVDKMVEKYPDLIEVEEAKQIGYLYLTQKVNDYLEKEHDSPIYIYLANGFNSWFGELLQKEKQKNQIQESLKTQLPFNNPEDDYFEESRLFFETLDCLQRSNASERDIWVFKEMLNGRSQSDIARELNVHRNMVNIISNRNRNNLKGINEQTIKSGVKPKVKTKNK